MEDFGCCGKAHCELSKEEMDLPPMEDMIGGIASLSKRYSSKGDYYTVEYMYSGFIREAEIHVSCLHNNSKHFMEQFLTFRKASSVTLRRLLSTIFVATLG